MPPPTPLQRTPTAAASKSPRKKPAARRPAGQLQTIDQIAELLQVTRRTIYRLIDSKQLPHLRIGYVLRFEPDAVLAWARDFTASGDKLRWQDDAPALSAPRDLPPSRQRTPTADVSPGKRARVQPDPAPDPAPRHPSEADAVAAEFAGSLLRRPDPRRTRRLINPATAESAPGRAEEGSHVDS